MSLRPGETLEHYRLVEQIGEGGMGVVWRAEDTTLDRQVAIKILPERFAADPSRRSRFEREAKTLAALNDPGIASIYSIHFGGRVPFLAMELVQGEALSRRIVPGGMALDELLGIACALADAVAAAHAAGIVHRDLKPDNVMLTSKRRVKVLDFGLAKLTDDASDAVTQAGTMTATQQGAILGTVSYMSPEQAEGLGVDARSDVFSLGTMLYEMATGRLPFAGQTTISTITAILRDAPRPLTELRAALPPALDAIVTRCLEKDPGRRFSDAGALRDALRAVDGASRDTPAQPATSFTTDVRPDAASAGPRRRKGRLALGVTAAAVVVLALAGWLGLHRKGTGGAGPAAPDAASGRTVAVLGFENLTDPDDTERLGRVLMGLITTDLVESRGLDVLSTPRVLAAIRETGGTIDGGFDLSVADRAAAEAGADLMLVGQVNRDGERILLTAELVDVHSGRSTGSIRREAGSNSQLFELAGSIAAEVRRQLGVPASGDGSARFDLAESLTSSADAYRQYAAGELELHLSHFDTASRRFEAAIELDPAFALAYYRLAMARSWSGQQEAANEALDRGLPHIERLPDHWQRLYLSYIDYEHGRFAEAHDRLATLVEAQIPTPDLYYVMSEITTHSSRYWDPRRVRALSERTLELDPTFGTVWFHLLQVYALADDDAAFRAALERRRKQGATREALLETELNLLLAERRFAEMEQPFEALGSAAGPVTTTMAQSWVRRGQARRAVDVLRAALGNPDLDDATTLDSLARAQASLGRFDEARENLETGVASRSNLPRAASNLLSASVRISMLTRELDRALRDAERTVELDPEYGAARYWLGRVWIERGDASAAGRVLQDLREVAAEASSPLATFWVDLLACELQLARGETAQALATLDRIAARPAEYRERPLEGLVRARALTAAGDTSGAIAAYREVLDPPYLLAGEQAGPWQSWPIYEIELLYPLARLEQADGQTERAREHFRAYVEHWGDADHPVVGLDDAIRVLRSTSAPAGRPPSPVPPAPPPGRPASPPAG